MEIPSYTVINDDRVLSSHVEQWRRAEAIAIDTEFMRTNTFFPKAGLIQLASPEGIFLIDPLAITDRAPLQALLTDRNVVKVLHSCSEDLELFAAYLGILPEPLFDTQLALAFLNKGFSVSYKNAVLQMFAVDLPKGEQRSDWLQRPLSKMQSDYAALDVRFLLDMHAILRSELENAGKLSWLEEECCSAITKQCTVVEPELAYLKIKAAWRLRGKQLLRLQRIAAWREREARAADTPRGFLLRDPVLLELVVRCPETKAELKVVEGIHPRIIRVYGDRLIELCAVQVADEEEPLQQVQAPLPKHLAVYVKQLKQWMVQCAEQSTISPELLFNRSTLNQMIIDLEKTQEIDLPAAMSGWKRDCCGAELVDFLGHLKGAMAQ